MTLYPGLTRVRESQDEVLMRRRRIVCMVWKQHKEAIHEGLSKRTNNNKRAGRGGATHWQSKAPVEEQRETKRAVDLVTPDVVIIMVMVKRVLQQKGIMKYKR